MEELIMTTTNEQKPIAYLYKQISCDDLVIYHPLQRSQGQWTGDQQSNLIRRVLQDETFLPILICHHADNGTSYLIDGVQRMTTICNYLDNGFSIASTIRQPLIKYNGVSYETKHTANGRFALKLDAHGNPIPKLDENGKPKRGVQTVDIRGLKFSQLPPELQDNFNNYCVAIQQKLMCTDEDIQLEILDYNSGTRMNASQVGKNHLGVDMASKITKLTKHQFIQDKCAFTRKDITKGNIDRSINEALNLVLFGEDNWNANIVAACKRLSEVITEDSTNDFSATLDDLDAVIDVNNNEVRTLFDTNQFFTMIGLYNKFKAYNLDREVFGEFINDFAHRLKYILDIPSGVLDEEGNEIINCYATAFSSRTGKSHGVVVARMTYLYQTLENWLKHKKLI